VEQVQKHNAVRESITGCIILHYPLTAPAWPRSQYYITICDTSTVKQKCFSNSRTQ